jgi:hypothetical protein
VALHLQSPLFLGPEIARFDGNPLVVQQQNRSHENLPGAKTRRMRFHRP